MHTHSSTEYLKPCVWCHDQTISQNGVPVFYVWSTVSKIKSISQFFFTEFKTISLVFWINKWLYICTTLVLFLCVITVYNLSQIFTRNVCLKHHPWYHIELDSLLVLGQNKWLSGTDFVPGVKSSILCVHCAVLPLYHFLV